MSTEVFEILWSMDRQKIELQVVLQCAPTIAGLKTSNLLIVPRDKEDNVRYVLRQAGLAGYRLVYDRKRVVFLVFNREKLISHLSSKEVRSFLKDYGYKTDAFGYYLRFFQERYDSYIRSRREFPHEMGVFLGYPLCDVKGFIEKGGEDFKVAGYWKVYDNAESTKKLFEEFDNVKDDMVRKLSAGYSIKRIMNEQSIEQKVS